MSLYNKTKTYLDAYKFRFKKSFGQNFIIDENILKNIVSLSNIDKETGVIEIGPGIGSLTEFLISSAKFVLAYEIDNNLKEILEERFNETENLKIIFKDILKADVNTDIIEYFNDCKCIYVVANLPYYITTPILMHLLNNCPKIEKYVVMVQKEMGERFLSNPNKKEYNALSVLIQYQMDVRKLINISRNIFIPKPNVDSIVIELKKKNNYKKAKNEEFFKEFVKTIFTQRRKTIINNLFSKYEISKDELINFFNSLNLDINLRAEMLNLDNIIDISDEFYKFYNLNNKN